MIAAWNGKHEAVALLLPVSDALAKCNSGQTALMHAVWNGNHEAVSLLLPVSDVLEKSNGGWTALMLAENQRCGKTASLIQAFLLSKEEQNQLTVEIPEGRDNKKGARL